MVNTFEKDIIPENEEQRIKALYNYTLMDTLPDAYFNNLAYIVAQFFQTPIALISFVESEFVFFKGNVGMEGLLKTDRGSSLCALAILNEGVTVFTDTLDEPCLLANPLVRGKFGLRFYAGAPLITPNGYPIGTLCIIDKEPRTFNNKERDILNRFSKIAMHELEMRTVNLTYQ